MKALAWYTVIFSILVIIAFILFIADVIDTPPFTNFETIAWAVLMVPQVILGILVLKKK
jgi:hypothetical protein